MKYLKPQALCCRRLQPHTATSLPFSLSPSPSPALSFSLISPINMQRLRSSPTGALGLWKICIILYAQRSMGHGGKIPDAEDSKADASRCVVGEDSLRNVHLFAFYTLHFLSRKSSGNKENVGSNTFISHKLELHMTCIVCDVQLWRKDVSRHPYNLTQSQLFSSSVCQKYFWCV